jgi:ABC-type transport system involved in cytochrome c biogenesis permease subunit
MKFWIKPPNRRATIIGFRIFFFTNLVGAIWGLTSQLVRHPRPAGAYIGAFEIGALWIAAIVVMVHFVEWWRNRETKNEATVVH